jgi:hypothetical protein
VIAMFCAAGDCIQHPSLADGRWREVLDSDTAAHGGRGHLNPGDLETGHGTFTAVLPVNAVLVFEQV